MLGTTTPLIPVLAPDVGALLRRIKEHNGITISLDTGHMPVEGYAVSIPGHEVRSRWALSEDTLRSYIRDHMEALMAPGAHLGVWWDDDDDTWYMDVSIVVGELEPALRLGAQWSQLAIYDLRRRLPLLVPTWMAYTPVEQGGIA
jgi:hypothetical protein